MVKAGKALVGIFSNLDSHRGCGNCIRIIYETLSLHIQDKRCWNAYLKSHLASPPIPHSKIIHRYASIELRRTGTAIRTAGAGGLLGRVVRALQGDGAGAGRGGGGIPRPPEGGEGETAAACPS